jgi:glycosyltransferase involved in cell wall biosynthesis
MKIGIFSTYNVKCGIGMYTKQIADGLHKQGHEVIIYCNFPTNSDQDVKYEDSPHKIIPCWEWFGRTEKELIDIRAINTSLIVEGVDVVHIQYESFLWHERYFRELKNTIPVIMTLHSTCISPHHQYILDKSSFFIVHESNFPFAFRNVVHIPSPVLEFTFEDREFNSKEVSLFSFGLSRNDDDFCTGAVRKCKELGLDNIQYKTAYGDKGGWLSDTELNRRIASSRYISLIYPHTSANVSSSAVCRALGSGSVVFTSDTNWFNHVKNHVHIVDNPNQMAQIICAFEGRSGKEVADNLRENWVNNVDTLNQTMGIKKVVEEHIKLYKKMLN